MARRALLPEGGNYGGFLISGDARESKMLVKQHLVSEELGIAVPFYGSEPYVTSVDLDPFNPDILLDDTVQMTGEVAYSDYPHTEVSVGTLSSADTGSVTVTQYDGNNEATITAVAPPDVDGERVTIKDRDYYDPIDEFGNEL